MIFCNILEFISMLNRFFKKLISILTKPSPMIIFKSLIAKRYFLFLGTTFCMLFTLSLSAQQKIALTDLSSFKNPGESWKIVGEVNADLEKSNYLSTTSGTGILVNNPGKKVKGEDLYTTMEHGDIDLELDYMMAVGSNSGVYLQGRYEVQLLDSWGAKTLSPGENGGIYQRWDESKPEGQKGYQGYAPRMNAGRAPGLWQHLKIAFKAPRFDEKGEKIENAKILKVELNGVIIHDEVELFGPTRGAMSEKEAATGPIRIQGDHGAVAFKNIVITRYDKPRPVLKNLEYTVYEGQHEKEPTYDSLPPEAEGTSVILSSNLKPLPQKFLLRYTGTLVIEEAGEYDFNLNVSGGTGRLLINDDEVIPLGGWSNANKGTVDLPKGALAFDLLYSKFVDWMSPALGLSVSGVGVREYVISDEEDLKQRTTVDPILVSAEDTPLLRSFMDIPNGPRVTHAVSVGSPQNMHYTYDLDKGSILQAWRGDFLDATPMWHDRGDGSSRPRGSIVYFTTQPQLSVAKLSSIQQPWVNDTIESSYDPNGYKLDENDQPTFLYDVYGTSIEDEVKVLPDGKGIVRNIRSSNSSKDLYVLLARGEKIESIGKNIYLVDRKRYYIKIGEASGEKPIIRSAGNQQELIIPLNKQLEYSFLF